MFIIARVKAQDQRLRKKQSLTKKNHLRVRVTDKQEQKNKEQKKTSASLTCGEGEGSRKREEPLHILVLRGFHTFVYCTLFEPGI